MSNRKSYYANFSTPSLFVLLKQSIDELGSINTSVKINSGLKKRKKELEYLIKHIKKLLKTRYLNEQLSLNNIANSYLNNSGIEKDVYKEVLLDKMVENTKLFNISLVGKVIDTLEIEDILFIMTNATNSSIQNLASKKYDQIIFDVDKEVYDEYLLKDEADCLVVEEEQPKPVESPFNIDDTITISRYVNRYLGIAGDCSNMIHAGLKDLKSDYVIGISNNYANSNPDLVYQGYLLLVMDANGNRGTYINPVHLKAFINSDISEELRSFNKERVNDLRKLKEYYYKYGELLKKVRADQEFSNLLVDVCKDRKVKRLIRERKSS